MGTETDLPSSATLLTHPSFDRPPVHNERRRGRKKGTHSLAEARRVRAAVGARASSGPGDRERLAGIAEGYAMADATLRARSDAEHTWNSRAKDSTHSPHDPPQALHEDAVIRAALAIIENRLAERGPAFEQTGAVKDYLCLQLAGLQREVFGVMFLDTRYRLIAFEILFYGGLTRTNVHPREVVRRALQLNAAAVVLAHNHPSDDVEPSRDDRVMTDALRQALALVDVRTLDHVIVGGRRAMSFAERGLL